MRRSDTSGCDGRCGATPRSRPSWVHEHQLATHPRPDDLSDFAGTALRWADMLQRRLGAQLTLVYANEPYLPFDVLEGPAAYFLDPPAASTRELRDRMKYLLNRCSDQTAARTSFTGPRSTPRIDVWRASWPSSRFDIHRPRSDCAMMPSRRPSSSMTGR